MAEGAASGLWSGRMQWLNDRALFQVGGASFFFFGMGEPRAQPFGLADDGFRTGQFRGSSPGARIEFNDAYVGTTPFRIRVPGGVGRKFSSGKILGHDFKAFPLPSGGSTQIKRFDAGSDIPEHLFFDMRLSYR